MYDTRYHRAAKEVSIGFDSRLDPGKEKILVNTLSKQALHRLGHYLTKEMTIIYNT